MEEPNILANSPNIKSQKGLKVGIVICVLLALAGIVFGIYGLTSFKQPASSDSTSDVTTPSEPDQQEQSVPTPTEVAKLLEEKYDFHSEEAMFCIGAHDIKCGLDNFGISEKLQFVISNIPEESFESETYVETPPSYIRNIKYNDLNDLFHKYFGNSENIEKADRDFEGFLTKMEYLSESDSFDIQFKDGLGGTSSIDLLSKVIETSKTKDGFSATVISAMIDHSLGVEDGLRVRSEEYLEYVQESLSAYKFNFISEDGGYKLTSIKKI